MAKHIKKNKSKLKLVLTIIFIIAIILLSIYLIKYFIGKNANKEKDLLTDIQIDTSKITEQKTEKMLKVEVLQKENRDIIGWLEIEGTNISYPVVQSSDNNYYLDHNYKKEYSKGGALFLDKDFNFEEQNTNYLIYGHRMPNGTMFEDLIKYKNKSYYEKHSIIKFTTNFDDSEYEIISVFLSRVYYKSETNVFRYYYFINAENEKEYNNYIENSKKEALYDTGKTAQYGDQLITLSTCSYHTEDGRLAVVAKKVK